MAFPISDGTALLPILQTTFVAHNTSSIDVAPIPSALLAILETVRVSQYALLVPTSLLLD